MANVVKNPRAGLERRDSDIHLAPKLYLKLSLFAQLKKPPTLDKFPGAVVVRRYRKGEELFRQGEPGWTAFYILSTEDALTVRQAQLAAASRDGERIPLQREITRLEEERRLYTGVPDDHPLRQVATVHMATLGGKYAGRPPDVQRMLNFKSRPSSPTHNREGQTIYIPVGGPQTLSYESGRAPLFEGDLFGEMSCLYRTPRSATVVANRDCYIVEFLRHILDAVHKDVVYKARADAIYRNRALELQVRKMAIFQGLKAEEFQELQQDVELVDFDAGDIVCDEHDRSDSMYLVRSGLVRVMKNVSHMLSAADVTDWVTFGESLRKGATLAGTPVGKFWTLLPQRARDVLQRAADLARLGPADRMEVIYGINDVLKERKLLDDADFKKLTEAEPIKSAIQGFPAQRKEWSDAQVRQHNRLLLEALYPAGIRRHAKHAGVETVLSYCSPGDYFGETGLMLSQPRNATCVAYGHPNHEGQVQLVKIPSKTFWRLMKLSPAVRDKVKEQIAERRKKTLTVLAKPVWEEANQVQFSEEFGRLGLIQGQQLMLIDLDRCTRCDECVRACVRTHGGSQTRLYLDGPRFGKYLVPTTCRSCLDPVCMIPCPVASIHRGDNREIVIEDWCIGCEACADACPYGSIRMHDLGIIPEESRGWRFLPATAKAAQGEWFKPGFRDDKWLSGVAPFVWEREFQSAVRAHIPPPSQPAPAGAAPAAILFRRDFELDRKQVRPESRFKFEVHSRGSEVRVWLNGRELTLDDRVKQGRHEYSVPPVPKKPDKADPKALVPPAPPQPPPPVTEFLRAGRNVVAVQVVPTAKPTEVLLRLRLDEIKKPQELPEEVEANVAEEAMEKLVTHRAVVCDLCSKLPSQLPACVHACPHDAALRVDARRQFPTR
jgi:CRP-like cAMP-binding protein/Fe-S-cluster-containing hydrogenase component 2